MENKTLKLVTLATLAVLPLTSHADGRCYGYSCHLDQQPAVNNCDPAVIQQNLEKLNALNIVSVTGLASFKPRVHGYNIPVTQEQDTCDKAEALAQAVTSLAPLAIPSQQ